MKYILALLVLASGIAELSFAEGPGALGLRKPVGTAAILDTSSTNVTTSAYVTLVAKANVTYGYGALLLSNGGTSPLILATGDAGSEVLTGLLIPPSSSNLLPINGASKVRLSLKSLSGTQSSGLVTISFFQ